MSDQPEFGWSLPPEENLAQPPSDPPPSPPPQAPPPQAPPPQAPPPQAPPTYVAPISTSPVVIDQLGGPAPLWKRWWFIAAIASVIVGVGAILVTTRDGGRPDAVTETEREGTQDAEPDAEPDTSEARDTDPTFVDISIPPISFPDFTTPTVSIPPISIPTISIPTISIPTISFPTISIPTISIPTISTPGATTAPEGPLDLPVIGETVTLGDGSTVRVNMLTNDVAPNPTFADAVKQGFTLTRIDYEACAGSDGFAGLNPLFWVASLDDGTSADVFALSYDIILLGVAPGACVRSQLDVEVPPTRTVTTVGVRDSGFQVAASWTTMSAIAVTGQLTSSTPIGATEVGQVVVFDDFGATATVLSATPNSEPLDPTFPADPGRQLLRVEVEVCAGSESTYASPQNWFATTIDGQIGAAAYFGATFPSYEIPPGDCVSGLIDIDLPANISARDIVYGNEVSLEVARWRISE